MILDGPIDSSWVENMSSVMDDTKILILENGERILIPKQVIVLQFYNDNTENINNFLSMTINLPNSTKYKY